MFVADLFEARISKTLVIMPGGFHPFHTGHMALYNAAVRAFPGADVYIAATNDTSERPFPFDAKKQLAEIAGVPAGHFVQVKSPFQAKEITQHYDPATTALIFVRSEKDADQPPKAGGVKKNGDPAYLQPISKQLAPMSQHGYMAYLPTVQFAGGITSATEIRNIWASGDNAKKEKIVKSLYPRNPSKALELLNSALTEDASGVIATQAQAKDPRYSMSLTKDVRPGQIDKNLKAFNLESKPTALTRWRTEADKRIKQQDQDEADYQRKKTTDFEREFAKWKQEVHGKK